MQNTRLSSLPPSRISPSKGPSEEAPPSISAPIPSLEPPSHCSPLPLSSSRHTPSDTPLFAETAINEDMEGCDIDEAFVSSLLEERKECDSPRSCNSPFKLVIQPELYIEGNPSPGSMNAAPHEVKAPLETSDSIAPTDEDINQYNRIPQALTEGHSTSRSDEKDHIQVLDRFQHSESSATSTCLSLVVEKLVTNWSISPYSGKRFVEGFYSCFSKFHPPPGSAHTSDETQRQSLQAWQFWGAWTNFPQDCTQSTSATSSLNLCPLSTVLLKRLVKF